MLLFPEVWYVDPSHILITFFLRMFCTFIDPYSGGGARWLGEGNRSLLPKVTTVFLFSPSFNFFLAKPISYFYPTFPTFFFLLFSPNLLLSPSRLSVSFNPSLFLFVSFFKHVDNLNLSRMKNGDLSDSNQKWRVFLFPPSHWQIEPSSKK